MELDNNKINSAKRHCVRHRIYYSDTDCGKVVYYANYLKYFEIGRTELLRSVGIELERYHQQDIIFVVVRVEIDYKSSAYYNDDLKIYSAIVDYNKKFFTVYNEIFNQADKLLVKGFTKCACVCAKTGKIINTPEEIQNAFRKLTDIESSN